MFLEEMEDRCISFRILVEDKELARILRQFRLPCEQIGRSARFCPSSRGQGRFPQARGARRRQFIVGQAGLRVNNCGLRLDGDSAEEGAGGQICCSSRRDTSSAWSTPPALIRVYEVSSSWGRRAMERISTGVNETWGRRDELGWNEQKREGMQTNKNEFLHLLLWPTVAPGSSFKSCGMSLGMWTVASWGKLLDRLLTTFSALMAGVRGTVAGLEEVGGLVHRAPRKAARLRRPE
ncbi:hypothetical protein C8R46DRAFT_1067372 [Mycena filopes]|nr:hypothetical protein C8R46DRAFT_1067372 [Mycena filopes]